MENDIKLSVETENLAVPEVHTGKAGQKKAPPEKKEPHIHINYETAVPEIIVED